MKIKLLIFLSLISLNLSAQFSKTHYLPPVSNTEAYNTLEQVLLISCPSTSNVNYKIIQLGGSVITGTVSRDNPSEIIIGSGSNTQLLASGNDVGIILKNKGFVVEADDLIYVTVRVAVTNHAGGLVSKGLAALGDEFRIGGFLNTNVINDARHYTFASVLATENNTVVNFSGIKSGTNLYNNSNGSTPFSVTLNSGESYIIATSGDSNSVPDGLIGALITSNKPIAVNCGSYGGSNGPSVNSSDIGFDQIVSAGDNYNKIGNEYIFIKGAGIDSVERPLIIAHENNTDVYINGNPTPIITLNAGEYIAFDGSNFSAEGNLYVRSTKNVFAYQGIAGSPNEANQNMHFLPPLSCQTPKSINNIPKINSIGSNSGYNGTVCIVTKTGANLNFILNGASYTLATLPSAGVIANGPYNVTGNPDYQTYTFVGLSGNVSVFSSESVYLSYYGSSGFATYGGFYSGFTFKPEISFNKVNITTDNCIPNVILNVNTISSFDSFEWSFNNNVISNASTNSYAPTAPGYYKVKAWISTCPTIDPLISDEIPVSSCAANFDGDSTNDNIDIDNDNDGILNCTESFGNQNINTAVSNGTIPLSTTTYIGSIITSPMTAAIPFTGNTDGTFVTEIPAGKQNFVAYQLDFGQPSNIGLEYPSVTAVSDLINANAEYVVNCDINKTITVLNPSNQLLIDTNYDGIFESGVTQFSSFEIRFRLNGSTPLASGTGTFQFFANGITTFKLTHKNLLDVAPNKSSFRIFAACVPKDSDNDGTADQLDTDSDNDGISDLIEAQNNSPASATNTDSNLNGLDNAFEPGFTPFDNDNDGIADYLDLDSDNDGISDSEEKTIDSDTDGIKNFRDLDSDADSCSDVKEAGFSDANLDGILGSTSPPAVNSNGMVTGFGGYTVPDPNYITAAPINITVQPIDIAQCLFENTGFSITTDAGTIQWQISTDNGTTWTNITDNTTYNGSNSAALNISNIQLNMSGHLYRTLLNKTGNSCDFYSNIVKLTVYPKPVLNQGIRIVQCDDNIDGISAFNLTVNNSKLSANFASETFTYFTDQNGAINNDSAFLITNPLAFTNTNPNMQTIWVRAANSNNCFEVISIQLISSTSNAILQNTPIPELHQCDDYIDNINNDYDGISSFDLTPVKSIIDGLLPSTNYTYNFYKNYNDFLQETDVNGNSLAITNITDYRNTGYPDLQIIWVRLEDSNTNDCVGSTSFKLVVEARPNIDTNTSGDSNTHICSDDPSVYQTLTSGLPANENPNDYTYEWSKNGTPLSYTTESISVNQEGDYKVVVSYITGLKCSRERNIKVEISNAAQLAGTPVVKDLVENNSITLTVTGDGNYVFALDDQFASTHPTGYFENLTPGLHTVYVLDLYGCSVLKVPFSIVGFPKYFTPNGDGYHDNWNIIGADTAFNADTKILIFDRFGKLIKEINPLSPGWDGTFSGKQLPSDDYWFTAQFKDGRNVKGHFSLKR
ncbi:T9SS type B sorting domain-containing protein [Flavobacterium sp. H122]|uniref:T9SS type B sorting domain-containing protein n=1 Tax=Flavobacterium sp. H122 TaxID=2529860 RepID=UPI0010AACBC2|nr:T9SS type B sorting domain-containing protein [Flavobacterium sp. H122]